jgi:hypothetical protein
MQITYASKIVRVDSISLFSAGCNKGVIISDISLQLSTKMPIFH